MTPPFALPFQFISRFGTCHYAWILYKRDLKSPLQLTTIASHTTMSSFIKPTSSPSPTSSTLSLLSKNSTSSAFGQSKKSKGQKNYFSALASLQSKYGAGGNAPVPIPHKPSVKSSHSLQMSHSSTTTHPTPAPGGAQPKNYEASFGALASSYGFGGAAPIVMRSKPKTSTTQPTSHRS